MLHGLQARALHEDDPGEALHSQAGCLHRDALRPSRRLQTGTGYGLLPGSLLRPLLQLGTASATPKAARS